MSFAQTQLEIKSGQSGTASLILTGVNGASEAVALTCAPSSSSIACSLSPASAAAGSTASVMINAFVASRNARAFPLQWGPRDGLFLGESVAVLAPLLLLACSSRKRLWQLAPSLCVFAILALQTACGGSGGGGTTSPPPPPPPTTPAPAGTYTVLVTGTAGGGDSQREAHRHRALNRAISYLRAPDTARRSRARRRVFLGAPTANRRRACWL